MNFQLADNLDTALNRARLHVWNAADRERTDAERTAETRAAAAILRAALDRLDPESASTPAPKPVPGESRVDRHRRLAREAIGF